jgi:hypothetical protein
MVDRAGAAHQKRRGTAARQIASRIYAILSLEDRTPTMTPIARFNQWLGQKFGSSVEQIAAASPISTATQTALDLKHNLITPATHIADPVGAATDQDDEARAKIVLILNALESAGIVAAS